jgi:endonuclease/exonuclease/phosphatase (EEP) superfamily protein YafD
MPLSRSHRRRVRRSDFRRAVELLLVLAVLGLATATVAPYFSAILPILGLFQHFAVQSCAAAVLLLTLMLPLRMWRWAALAAVLMVWHAAAIAPFLPVMAEPRPVEGAPLKVMSLNLYYRNEDHEPSIQYLLESGADVIGTVETTAEWRESLKALQGVYPYHVDCVKKVFRCGVAIFSKIPFTATFADRIDGKLPTIVTATIDFQGKPLTIAELQLINPLIGIDEDFQARQAAIATEYFAGLEGDLVVMGDFNSAPWSRLQAGFRAATGLDNHGRLAFTWPSWAPAILRLPIDQIFTRGGVAARNVHPADPEGSDHLPIRGEIYRTANPSGAD